MAGRSSRYVACYFIHRASRGAYSGALFCIKMELRATAFARWMQNQTYLAHAATQQAVRLTAERDALSGW